MQQKLTRIRKEKEQAEEQTTRMPTKTKSTCKRKDRLLAYENKQKTHTYEKNKPRADGKTNCR